MDNIVTSPWIIEGNIALLCIKGKNPHELKNQVAIIDSDSARIRVNPYKQDSLPALDFSNWTKQPEVNTQEAKAWCEEMLIKQGCQLCKQPNIPLSIFPDRKELLSELPDVNPFDFRKKGGNWLAAARTYLQSNVKGGDSCTWGSEQPLTMTVKQVEELAAETAMAAVNEYKKTIQGL